MPAFSHLIKFAPVEIKDAITIFFAVVAGTVALIQYIQTSHNEFLKPIREEQLKLYEEAASSAAILATQPKDSEVWKKANVDFLRLYWGPLAMVEDYKHGVAKKNDREITVEMAMIAFKKQLDANADSATLQNFSLALAHTCRVSLGTSWGVKAKQLRGDYQKIIIESQDKAQ